MNDLNQYASTIRLVFEKLASQYDDGSGDSGNDVVADIVRAVDADTVAEIIHTAKQVDDGV